MAPTFDDVWAERQERPPSSWDEQSKQIIAVLQAHGIRKEDVDTDDYRFAFPYKGFAVEVFNHGSGLSGIIHKKPSTPTERDCLDDADTILNTARFTLAERLQFVIKFQYKKFRYPGDPARLVADVIRHADTPVNPLMTDYLFRG